MVNALRTVGAATQFVTSPDDAQGLDGIVLPGVGSFGYAASSLVRNGLDRFLVGWAESRPLLGVCLGMQLMFEESEESPGKKGLGVLEGRSVRLKESQVPKIPNMGWDLISVDRRGLLGRPGDTFYGYFAHSYVCEPAEGIVEAWSGSGDGRFAAAVRKGLMQGVQFHPEKSGAMGLAILGRFADSCKEVARP